MHCWQCKQYFLKSTKSQKFCRECKESGKIDWKWWRKDRYAIATN